MTLISPTMVMITTTFRAWPAEAPSQSGTDQAHGGHGHLPIQGLAWPRLKVGVTPASQMMVTITTTFRAWPAEAQGRGDNGQAHDLWARPFSGSG